MPEIFEDGGMFEYREAQRKKAEDDYNDMVSSWLRETLVDFETFSRDSYCIGSVYETMETTDDLRVVFTAYNAKPGEEHLLPELPKNKHYEIKPDENGQNRAVIITDYHVGD